MDSHALLSVPGQIQASQKRSVTGDLTSDTMIDSLEQILEDIGDGGIEGFEVEETELRDWENTLVRMNEEREDVSTELNHILANDVFSYVEEALRRETGGCVQDSDQVSWSMNSLSLQGQHAGFLNNEWQQMMDMKSSFAQQTLLEDVLGGSTGLKGAPHVVSAPTQCRNTHHTHASSLWPPNHHCGNQMISTQPCHAEVTQHSWLPSVQNNNNIHNSSHQSGPNHSVQYAGSQQLQSPSVWRQQLPQSFHHHTPTHSSHTLDSTAQRLSGSCMYEKREGHIPNAATVPARHNGPLLGGTTHVAGNPFTLHHPGTAVGVINHQGMMQSSSAGCTDVGNISMVHLSGANTGLGSEYPSENGSLQSTFFCWNGDAQVK